MKVNVSYIDNDSFTKEEIVRTAVHNYGKNVTVEVLPESTNAHDFLYFGIQHIITHEQLGLLFNNKDTYQQDIKKLRAETMLKLQEILDTVIIDNEEKVS